MKLEASDEHEKEGGGVREGQKRVEFRSTLLYAIVVHQIQLRDSRSSEFEYGYGQNLRYLQVGISRTCPDLASEFELRLMLDGFRTPPQTPGLKANAVVLR
jgi:hypothetical protein